MNKFRRVMAKKPPHVWVKHDKGNFSYGVKGNMPIGQLVGYLVRVQAELAFRKPEECDGGLCVVAYDPETKKLCWFVDGTVPVDELVGTLELVKCQLVDSQMMHMAQQAAQRAQTGLVDTAGKPIFRGGQ